MSEEEEGKETHEWLDVLGIPRGFSKERYGMNTSWNDEKKYSLRQRIELLTVEFGRLKEIERRSAADYQRPIILQAQPADTQTGHSKRYRDHDPECEVRR